MLRCSEQRLISGHFSCHHHIKKIKCFFPSSINVAHKHCNTWTARDAASEIMAACYEENLFLGGGWSNFGYISLISMKLGVA